MQPISLKQERDFLFQCYFGTQGSELDRFLSRAYRDMNRTLRRIAILDPDGEIRKKGNVTLTNAFQRLQQNTDVPDFNKYDEWHRKVSDELIANYAPVLEMAYGQAQKWINMTMKYCMVCGGSNRQGLAPWFPFAHIPVDGVILTIAKEKEGVVSLPYVAWSKWDTDRYLKFQNKIRSIAEKQGLSPLELEFNWFQQSPITSVDLNGR